MSERPIQKGDLVMMIRRPLNGCCDKERNPVAGSVRIGVPFTVKDIWWGSKCAWCGKIFEVQSAEPEHVFLGVPLSWLIRIDPPATGDTLPTRADAGIKERV